jgi:hypothetical protein
MDIPHRGGVALERLGEVGRRGLVGAGEVGDRAGELQHAVVAAGGQAELRTGGAQELGAGGVEAAVGLHLARSSRDRDDPRSQHKG